MNSPMTRVVGLTIALGACAGALAAPAPPPNYQFITQINLPGDSGWDYLSIDPAARRLYVTHGDKIDVLDIDRNQLVGSISDTPRVHGFAIAHELNRGFASDGQSSEVSVVDLKTLATVKRITTGTGPDAIVYNPHRNEVYTFNGGGNSSTVIDALSNKVVSTIVLPGKPEFAAVDPAADRIYANIEDKNLVIAIDGQSHRIAALWQISPGENPSGLAIDTAHHRLFVGCRNQKMLMVDSQSGAVLAMVPIGRFVDANVFDPQTQLAFSSNGEGTLTIAHEDGAAQLRVLQTVNTQIGARTMALDPKTHNVYLVTAEPSPAQAAAGPARRPAMVPGSFRVLVYGPVH
jgi:DNA-binding beta-propeller fold protein YncE